MRLPARALFLSVVSVLLLGGAATAHAVTRSGSSPSAVAKHAPLTPPPLDTFTFVGAGDIALTGDADASVLAGIRRFLLHTDLVIGNLEGTLATGGAPKCSGEVGCFTFRGSPDWARTLRRSGF